MQEALQWLRQLRCGLLSLTDVVYSGVVPASVLHHFACDCAERVLLQQRVGSKQGLRSRVLRLLRRSKESEFLVWEALRTKRMWIEGERELSALIEIREDLKSQSPGFSWRGRRDVWATVHCALSLDAKDAAWSAAWYAAGMSESRKELDEERAWQRLCLAGAWESYRSNQTSLLSVLEQHQTIVRDMLDESQSTMEALLFR